MKTIDSSTYISPVDMLVLLVMLVVPHAIVPALAVGLWGWFGGPGGAFACVLSCQNLANRDDYFVICAVRDPAKMKRVAAEMVTCFA